VPRCTAMAHFEGNPPHRILGDARRHRNALCPMKALSQIPRGSQGIVSLASRMRTGSFEGLQPDADLA
jgi:hypothetical protein